MTMNQAESEAMAAEINVTPMIDVLLVLLIIFMLIVPTISNGEAALVPKPAKKDAHVNSAVVLEVVSGIGGQTGFRINQQSVSNQDLPGKLEAIYANRADRSLFVKADDEVAFAKVAGVIDLAHAAGIDRVGLLTPRVEAGL
jgi:biopolymer transport protein TolR